MRWHSWADVDVKGFKIAVNICLWYVSLLHSSDYRNYMQINIILAGKHKINKQYLNSGGKL